MIKYIYAFGAGFVVTGAAVTAYRFKTTVDQRASHWSKVTDTAGTTIEAIKSYVKGLFNGSCSEAATA